MELGEGYFITGFVSAIVWGVFLNSIVGQMDLPIEVVNIELVRSCTNVALCEPVSLKDPVQLTDHQILPDVELSPLVEKRSVDV